MMNLLGVASFLADNIDIIFVVIILLFAIYGAFKGFFAQLAGFLVTLVAVITATFLARPFMLFISEHTPLVTTIASALDGWVSSAFPSLASVDAGSIAESLQNVSLPEAVKTTIQSYALNEAGETINLSGLIARAVAGYIMLSICFLLIVLVVKLIFLIIRNFGKKMRKNLAVKIVDVILGGLLALTKAVFFTYFLVFLINLIPIPLFDGFKAAISSSKILKFIMEYNFVEMLLKLLQL